MKSLLATALVLALFLASPVHAADSDFEACVRALPYLVGGARTVGISTLEQRTYRRHCSGANENAALGVEIYEVPIFAQYGSRSQFCKVKAQEIDSQTFQLGVEENVAIRAFSAYETCLRLAQGGFVVIPQFYPASDLLGVDIKKTSADAETIYSVSLDGFDSCGLSGGGVPEVAKLSDGQNQINRQVQETYSNLTCTRGREQEPGNGKLYRASTIVIATSKGTFSLFFDADRVPGPASLNGVNASLAELQEGLAESALACAEATEVCRCAADTRREPEGNVVVCLSFCPDGRVVDFRVKSLSLTQDGDKDCNDYIGRKWMSSPVRRKS